MVSESSIPNNYLIVDADLGFIANYGDDHQMTEMVEAAIYNKWDREHAMRYILENHTWTRRGRIYEEVIKADLGVALLNSIPEMTRIFGYPRASECEVVRTFSWKRFEPGVKCDLHLSKYNGGENRRIFATRHLRSVISFLT